MRLPSGGRIDRSRPLSFTFDGRRYEGFAGDTLASALLANGVKLVGRSFKYHRPRGIFTAGPEEPNALVRLRTGNRAEPNTRATMIELFDGLVAESQHRWPSLEFDLGAAANLLSPLFPAGFYYKTFMGAPGWMFYERYIRRAAGLGVAPSEPDPDRYDHAHAHCDVLVVGAGPTGCAAAEAAAQAGARVMLLDERPRDVAPIGDAKILTRTTAFAYYDQNMVCAVEHVADHLAEPPPHAPRQRLWWIRAKEVVLATGAIERPIIFAGNDLPGVMLAGAAKTYVEDFAVRPGRRAVVFTNNDSGLDAARSLAAAGVDIAAVVDSRPGPRDTGLRHLAGHIVLEAHGRRAVRGVDVALADDPQTRLEYIDCDLLAVSGGWTPSLHLHSQAGGKTVWDERIAAFVPGQARQRHRSVGAARGIFDHDACIADGAGRELPSDESVALNPLWAVPRPKRGGKCFVDLQDDVTTEDIALAEREGFRSVEHLKRYTTLGMGTDQGKTSNIPGLALLAERRGEPVPAVGHTTFRPPYTPVTLGAIVGAETGRHFEPIRRTPMHDRHEAMGALFVEAGLWLRAQIYPRTGETIMETIRREVNTVRAAGGVVDVSTLGKIDIQGPDAAAFLDRVYTGRFSTLPVGRARYGLMLREDGIVFDDGTTSRLGPEHFYMTTTTANAVKVMQHLEFFLQTVWPGLRVSATSVTEQWAAMAVAGPHARDVLARLSEDFDASDAGLPHMGVREGRVAGVPARVFRLSFSGERAYEIAVPADHGAYVWDAVLEAGRPLGIVAYGTEAMGVMRIEKGHVAGPELDGRTTAEDLGLGRLLAAKDFIGKRALEKAGLRDTARRRLVGLVPVDGHTRIRAGAQLLARGAPPMIGHVTSQTYSPTLGKPLALALLSGGLSRLGEHLQAAFPLKNESVEVTVVDPVFFDPEGKRLHG